MLFKPVLSLISPAGQQARLTIFIFHRVLPQPDPLFPGEPTVHCFDEMMCWVAAWFNVLPLDEAVERLRRGGLPARAAAITFDDGYADNLLHAAPILKKYRLTATIFIATGYLDGGIMWNDVIIESIRQTQLDQIELGALGLGLLTLNGIEQKRSALEKIIGHVKHLPIEERKEAVEHIRNACACETPHDLMLTSAQVRELRSCGMGIGAHTVNHPILAKCSMAAARNEIADSRDFLEGLLKEPVSLFAYPNGKLARDYLVDHVALVKALGFSCAFTTHWGAASAAADPFQLPRFTPWDKTSWRFGLRLLKNYGLSYPGRDN